MSSFPQDLPTGRLDDAAAIALALRLAREAGAEAPPNPAVGCVLVDGGGRLVGVGRTQRTGGPHAEVMALRDARERGAATEGTTAYVTLEPCAHHGRTGPCCEALAAAGVRRVVGSLRDPNPQVAGRGFDYLRRAGVQVEVGAGAEAAAEINIGFLSRMSRGLPWVRLKAAASVDGRTALPDGTSQWITGEAARTDGHGWRARAGAILSGVGTLLEDDPQLDVRLVPASRQPPLVVIDSRLQTPPAARVFAPARPVWIYAAQDVPERRRALEARGADVRVMPNADGKVALDAVLRDLAVREVNELHVESGHKLNGSLVREGHVDEWLLYLAPMLIGEGLGLASHPYPGTGLRALADAQALDFRSVDRIGPDLRILARVRGRDDFLRALVGD